ncbi:gamma-interferon inducible lysosomal thiol reductase gilt [Anaeramoeba ignava]|uniref:Gamma-interferon inducible lysosomal thiol reductase gilt n=1 Tax=Anaeramoeba ignava TaxID=1746090 RepID=A0A9Q0RB29_ANAIG|nr:gamma-interferon inducible lysosomal thiol reductase gilt [Anaeramoeba ignava]
MKLFFLLFLLFPLTFCQDPVNLHLYAMSKCPDCTSWETVFSPVVSKIPTIFTLDIDFFGSYESSEDGITFTCPHGETECIGDMYELCARKYFEDDFVFFAFIMCLDEDRENIPNNVRACAENTTGMSWTTLAKCYNSEGETLLKNSIDNTNNAGVDWAPTIFLQGKKYCEWHQYCPVDDWQGFRDAICNAYTGTKPSGCYGS